MQCGAGYHESSFHSFNIFISIIHSIKGTIMRNIFVTLIAVGVIAASANATTVVGCTTYATANSNGSQSFPGSYVGTAGNGSGQVCQIGNLSLYNGGTGGAYVNTNNNPSIYELNWGGGALTITEMIGNNGIGDAIDVQFDSLAGLNSASPSGTLATIQIPFSSGPSSTYTLYSGNLAAGYYAIDTYLAIGNAADPNFQINLQSSVPEPSALFPLLAAFLALLVWARQTKLRAVGYPSLTGSDRSDVSAA
jgi:hypothetical protein